MAEAVRKPARLAGPPQPPGMKVVIAANAEGSLSDTRCFDQGRSQGIGRHGRSGGSRTQIVVLKKTTTGEVDHRLPLDWLIVYIWRLWGDPSLSSLPAPANALHSIFSCLSLLLSARRRHLTDNLLHTPQDETCLFRHMLLPEAYVPCTSQSYVASIVAQCCRHRTYSRSETVVCQQ